MTRLRSHEFVVVKLNREMAVDCVSSNPFSLAIKASIAFGSQPIPCYLLSCKFSTPFHTFSGISMSTTFFLSDPAGACASDALEQFNHPTSPKSALLIAWPRLERSMPRRKTGALPCPSFVHPSCPPPWPTQWSETTSSGLPMLPPPCCVGVHPPWRRPSVATSPMLSPLESLFRLSPMLLGGISLAVESKVSVRLIWLCTLLRPV